MDARHRLHPSHPDGVRNQGNRQQITIQQFTDVRPARTAYTGSRPIFHHHQWRQKDHLQTIGQKVTTFAVIGKGEVVHQTVGIRVICRLIHISFWFESLVPDIDICTHGLSSWVCEFVGTYPVYVRNFSIFWVWCGGDVLAGEGARVPSSSCKNSEKTEYAEIMRNIISEAPWSIPYSFWFTKYLMEFNNDS